MRYMDIKHQQFKVNDYLSWQREGSLVLSPSFQRRPVWKPSAKSYLIDTVAKNLPVPVIFVRERLDLKTQRTVREVVDGQQRLRTLFSFIDSSCLTDFDPKRDPFNVSARHNKELANKNFGALDDEIKSRILSYEFSTHVLPSTTEDRDVLMIFARMNSTGVQLNGQEIRNAEYFGLFKSAMYDLALEQLDRWRDWKIFSEEQIARMAEVELTSDLCMIMIDGMTGKSQAKINAIYKRLDPTFPGESQVSSRFQKIMDQIQDTLGDSISSTVFSSEVYFFTLFVFLYDLTYGLKSPMDRPVSPQRVPHDRLRLCLDIADKRLNEWDVPDSVRDAVVRASADLGRRRTRHDFLRKIYAGEPTS